jgi:phosphomannomutase
MGQRPHLSRYQWEGVFGAEFTLAAVRGRCRALARSLAARRLSCLVAHDTRFMAGQFALDAYRMLEGAGIGAACCLSPAPFPAVELALEQRKADCALVVSAGNRPYWYGGLILLAPPSEPPPLAGGDPAVGDEPPFPPQPAEGGERGQIDLRAPYLELLRGHVDIELIRRAPLTVFVDPMNGAASGYLPAAIGEGAQAKAIEINRETDALFGRQTPQPAEVGLNRLRKLVKESDSHLGVALSADGRALAVADHTGEIVPPLDLALLLAQYLGSQHRQRGLVVAPAGSPEPAGGLKAWEDAYGLKVELAAEPAARAAEVAGRDRGSLLVSVTAGGEVTMGRYGATPDGTLAALVLVEIVARFGEKLRPLVEKAKRKA